jgi:hypothetical protein
MNRINAMALVLLAAFIGLAATTASAQERMRAGLWEMATTKDGKPINSGTRCLTAEEARSNNGDEKSLRDTLKASFAKASCTVKDVRATGNAVSYVAECGTGASAHTLTSSITYRGDTVEIQMTSKRPTATDTMITKGHRVGACK